MYVYCISDGAVKSVQIQKGATGYNYERVFGDCIDESVTQVLVRDPFIFSGHQVSYLFFLKMVFLVAFFCLLVFPTDDAVELEPLIGKVTGLLPSLPRNQLYLLHDFIPHIS